MSTPSGHRPCLSRLLHRLPLSALLLGWLLLPTASQAAVQPGELLDAGRVDEALRLLVPEADANNAAALNYVCRAYYALGDWDNAVRNCERAAQLEPGNST